MFSLITIGFGVITLVFFSFSSHTTPANTSKVYRLHYYLETDGWSKNSSGYYTKCCLPRIELPDQYLVYKERTTIEIRILTERGGDSRRFRRVPKLWIE